MLRREGTLDSGVLPGASGGARGQQNPVGHTQMGPTGLTRNFRQPHKASLSSADFSLRERGC